MNLPPSSTLARAFTLLELMVAVAIGVLMLMIAVPSIAGLYADQQLRAKLEEFDAMVQGARQLSMDRQAPVAIHWSRTEARVQTPQVADESKTPGLPPGWVDPRAPVDAPSEPDPDTRPAPTSFPIPEDGILALALDKSLASQPPASWTFWPSGVLEPATITYRGPDGTWTVQYHPLSGDYQILHFSLDPHAKTKL
jgi:prepilin-type N-terminal cleavage/methylation domain-containing protein